MTIRLPIPYHQLTTGLRKARLWSLYRPGGRAGGAALLGLLFLSAMGAEIAVAAGKTGLPLPRYVSLRKAEVYVRTGPGTRYPVDWVFTYQNMPVEIVAEFDAWRKVRDWEGILGWVHKSMLSGKRWIIVPKDTGQLHREDNAQAPVVARLKKKVLARLKQCRGVWCEVTLSGVKGWIKRSEIWGVYRSENIR